jgi:hypothetical protein
MQIAKYTYPPTVLILSLGLLYSQVCNVICSSSNCSAWASVRRAASVEHAGHCHQKRPSSQQERPSDDSQNCPGHHSVVSILPSDTLSTAVSHHILQPAAAELAYELDILSDSIGSRADYGGHFRSPPKRTQFTVLRI